MFLDWFRFSPPDAPTTVANAWQVFSAADVVLAILAGGVVLLAALRTMRTTSNAFRYVSGVLMGVAGMVVLGVVGIRVAFPPGAPELLGVIGVSIEASRLAGAFVGVAAALTMAVSGVVLASGVVLEGVSRAFERLNRDM
jgi:hypothetical protein